MTNHNQLIQIPFPYEDKFKQTKKAILCNLARALIWLLRVSNCICYRIWLKYVIIYNIKKVSILQDVRSSKMKLLDDALHLIQNLSFY